MVTTPTYTATASIDGHLTPATIRQALSGIPDNAVVHIRPTAQRDEDSYTITATWAPNTTPPATQPTLPHPGHKPGCRCTGSTR